MANLFDSVRIKNHKRNKFNLSSFSKLTTEFGRLTPILCEPVLPSDKFTIKNTLKVQFAPMTFPVMERFKAYIHYWFVPNRLIWDNWEKFITGGETGIEDTEHSYPVIEVNNNVQPDKILATNFGHGSLFDYLGFPAQHFLATDSIDNTVGGVKYFDALPFKAYQKIYDEFYRDQNLETAMDLQTDVDGVQNPNGTNDAFVNGIMSIRYRAWRKDYFTSAMKDPQRGPDVTLPMFGQMYLDGNGAYAPVEVSKVEKIASATQSTIRTHSSGGSIQFLRAGDNFVNDDQVKLTGQTGVNSIANAMSVDTEDVRMASINEVRKGFALQRIYELAARVGGRYPENILGNFGVHAGDPRMQRPEFLGGSTVPIFVGDVLQTSQSTEDGTPLGMPAGVAGALGGCREFSRHFSEHGWIIGILSIVPEATYSQGIPRKFLKRDRLDFAWPLLANIGEQEIANEELYFDWNKPDTQQKAGFGYTPRYAEYRFGLNSIHGDFRGSLADFHDARIFTSAPVLNNEFIKVKPTGNSSGLNRIFAVQDANYDHLWVNVFNDVLVRRKLPKYGTPI